MIFFLKKKSFYIFPFIKNEYKIKMGKVYHYIDILHFNVKYNYYFVVKLKITDLNSRYIDQVLEYVNYIDKNVKIIHQNKTINIILVKRNNTFIVKCTTINVLSQEYMNQNKYIFLLKLFL